MKTECQTLSHWEEKSGFHFHIHILFCIKVLKKTALLYVAVCIPEGKPIWQVESRQMESHSQNSDQNNN